jgi:hypothetical protein
MKTLIPAITLVLAAPCFAGDAPATAAAPATHRYLIERTFQPHALDGLNSETKSQVNQNNAKFGVHWVMSYANADKTKTYCVYEGPSEKAVRKAAEVNKLPVDSITEVPVTLMPN